MVPQLRRDRLQLNQLLLCGIELDRLNDRQFRIARAARVGQQPDLVLAAIEEGLDPPVQVSGRTVDRAWAGHTVDILQGGALVAAMRDWIHDHLSYVPGASNADTTASDTFIRREGVCSDYAHLMITLTRAAGIPARIASVYALGVDPPDFHAVAEVFLGNGGGGEWHLVDPTGMASEGAMAKIGVGRDAADVSFLTAFGEARMIEQSVEVSAV